MEKEEIFGSILQRRESLGDVPVPQGLKVEGLLGQKELYIVYLQVGLSNPTLATG